MKREERIERLKKSHEVEKEAKKAASSASVPDESQSDDSSEDCVLPSLEKKQKKGDVTISIPQDIVQKLAPSTTRFGVSNTALSSILLQTIAIGGGDIRALPLSRR